jgi:hypothetical protein
MAQNIATSISITIVIVKLLKYFSVHYMISSLGGGILIDLWTRRFGIGTDNLRCTYRNSSIIIEKGFL